jgi:hypothetical protein
MQPREFLLATVTISICGGGEEEKWEQGREEPQIKR